MNRIKDIVNDVAEIMDRLESEREKAIALSRTVIRGTKRVIHSIHLREPYDLKELQKAAADLMNVSKDPEILLHVRDAMAEFAEACILSAVAKKEKIPSFCDLNMTPQAWILGLADSIGEMRRMILDSMLRDEMDDAERVFGCMETFYEEIIMIDTPDAVLPIRRKQDIARSVMERTRTDLVNAKR